WIVRQCRIAYGRHRTGSAPTIPRAGPVPDPKSSHRSDGRAPCFRVAAHISDSCSGMCDSVPAPRGCPDKLTKISPENGDVRTRDYLPKCDIRERYRGSRAKGDQLAN